MNLPPNRVNIRSVFAACAQSHPLVPLLLAAIFVIGLLSVPFIHSAGTGSQDILLFDPGKYTATELSTSTLNDGIPDVWKTWYGLSVIDSTVANADYTGTGIMNSEKYQLNIYPLAPVEAPPLVAPKTDKSTANNTATSSSGPLLQNMNFSDGAGLVTHPTSGGYNVKFSWNYNDWGDGTKFGWKAVKGSVVEVWKDPSGKHFVELNSSANSSGIEQKIINAQPGTYLLSWRHLGRHEIPAGDNAYSVQVFARDAKNDTGAVEGGIPITTTPPKHIYHAPSSKDYKQPSTYPAVDNWAQEFVVFTLTKEIITAHPDIWIAFVAEQKGTYGAFIADVHLAPVEIKWEKVGDNWDIEDNKDPDGNWMPGKGKRMFVDAKSQTETKTRDTVYVKITGVPQGTKVYLKALDVDDPTPDSLDPEHLIDPNDNEDIQRGDDNRGYDSLGFHQPPHFVSSGDVTVTCTVDANGIAKLDNGELPKLQMTDHPGDNVRVAAAFLNASGLSNLQVGDSTQPGYVEPSDNVPQEFGGALSQMLTVWRKLNIEIDSMDAVPENGDEKNYEAGTITAVSSGSAGQSKVTLNITLTGPADRYENGHLIIAGNSYKIVSNTDNLINGDDVIVVGAVPSSADGQSFKIKDDDDNFLKELGLPAALPRNQLHENIIKAIRPKFAPAYIQIEDANELGLNIRQTISFKLNATPDSAFGSYFNNGEDLSDSEPFWAFTVTFGYQSTTDLDRDPNTKDSMRGATPKVRYIHNAYGFSAIYSETIRDRALEYMEGLGANLQKFLNNPALKQQAIKTFYDILYGTVAHEIGHGTGSQSEDEDHDESGLMDATGPPITTSFTPKTIRRFRDATRWTH